MKKLISKFWRKIRLIRNPLKTMEAYSILNARAEMLREGVPLGDPRMQLLETRLRQLWPPAVSESPDSILTPKEREKARLAILDMINEDSKS